MRFLRRRPSFALTLIAAAAVLLGVPPKLRAQGGEPQYFAIKNATVVPVSGPRIENATVIVSRGVISAIGKDAATATLTPFIENNLFLARLNDYYNGNYLGQATIIDLARANGYAVAVVGKLGPTAIQDIAEIRAPLSDFQPTSATIIDDTTGPQGIPLPQNVREEMNASGLPASTPDRSNGHEPSSRHNNGHPGTLAANFYQQQYLANAATQAVLPAFRKQLKPFFLIFWFLFQLWQANFSLTHPDAGGGVAFAAHVGGFVFGAVAVKAFQVRPPLPVPR